jgi:hypothetical protein
MRSILLVLAIAVLATTPALAQPATDPFLITPGVGIGPIALGMSITDVTKVLGTPHPAETKFRSIVLQVPDGSLGFAWDPSPEAKRQGAGTFDGFVVITDKAGAVYEVQSPFDNRYHTAQGLHVGSRPSDVMAALGTPSRQPASGHEQFYVYDQRGIALLIQTNRQAPNVGLVNGVWVFAPRATP